MYKDRTILLKRIKIRSDTDLKLIILDHENNYV